MKNTQAMTKTERTELVSFIKRRTKAARAEAEQIAAQQKAQVEDQLCAIYTPDDDAVMAELRQEAAGVMTEVNVRLAERCAELKIPTKFAPKISMSWYGRGENAIKERRVELRKMAYAEIESRQRQAYARIEHDALALEGEILSHGLTSDAARQFLAEMPSVEALMPPLESDLRLLEKRSDKSGAKERTS